MTIILITTPTQEAPNGRRTRPPSSGDLDETDYTNNTASATVKIIGHVHPAGLHCGNARQAEVGRSSPAGGRSCIFKLTTEHTHNAVKGVRLKLTGGGPLKGFHLTTKPSNAHGKISLKIRPKSRGILYFTPIVTKPNSACGGKIGISDVFTPPVTG